MTFDVHQLDAFVLAGSAVAFLAILAVRLSTRFGMPTLLFYLLIGVLMGEGGLGIVFDDAQLAHALGFGALAVILAEGGITTDWSEVRGSMRIGGALATVGVAVSVLSMALMTHFFLGLDWEVAVLLGAITAPTDAAAVFSMLRVLPLPRRLVGALEAESGLNDAPTVVLVTVISSGAFADSGLLGASGIIVYELFAGVAVGLLTGFGGAWVMRRAALPASGLYPVAVLCLAFLAYGSATAIHASGFASVYVAALVLGNSELPHRSATRSFTEGLAWLAQIGLFVMLGLLLSPGDLTMTTLVTAVIAGGLLATVARPLSVLVSSLVDPMPWRELAFLSWAGLRGAVPIVLATIPLAEDVPGAHTLFNVVFVLVVIDTLATGPTLPWAARRLKVTRRSEPRGLEVEAAPLGRIAADLLQVTIAPSSRMHGVEVCELRLQQGCSVSLVIRDGESIVPDRRFVLRHGDDLLVVTPRKLRRQTEQRLREVSAGGRLAGWLHEDRRSEKG